MKTINIKEIETGVYDVDTAAFLMVDAVSRKDLKFVYKFEDYKFHRDNHNVVTVVRRKDNTIIFQEKFSTLEESDTFLNKIWGWE